MATAITTKTNNYCTRLSTGTTLMHGAVPPSQKSVSHRSYTH
ncbi:hypothetical protein [Pleomorphochaeta sp. DL1XJH-081]